MHLPRLKSFLSTVTTTPSVVPSLQASPIQRWDSWFVARAEQAHKPFVPLCAIQISLPSREPSRLFFFSLPDRLLQQRRDRVGQAFSPAI
jgi:hypothetical protein